MRRFAFESVRSTVLVGAGATGLVAAICALPAHAWASECEAVRSETHVAELPAKWQDAVEQLEHATARPDKPWSCSGGTVDVILHEGGATLIIRRAGANGDMVARELESPDDLAPLGEAMLAKPLAHVASGDATPPPVGPASPPSAPSTSPTDAHATDPGTATNPPGAGAAKGGSADAVTPNDATKGNPKAIVHATLAPRYVGNSNRVMGSAEVGVSVPISSWVPGARVRFDGPLGRLDDRIGSFAEVCVIGSFGRVFSAGPVDITPSLTGSFAVILKDDDAHQMNSNGHKDNDVPVDGRVGAEVRVAFPRTSFARAHLSADFEVAPGEFDQHPPPDQTGPARIELPTYTIGLGFGVEIAPR